MYKSKILILPLAALAASCSHGGPGRAIGEVAPIAVECPVGTAPRLPSRVWVRYDDGAGEFRQVRWSNSQLADELALADSAAHAPGSSYSVCGYIVGEPTTPYGFPVSAQVSVVAGPYAVPRAEVATAFPLSDVSLDGDNRLTRNRDEAIEAICGWDVAQQLYNYRDTYGLPTDGYPVADGWDSPDTKLKGHGSGHYMSALAQAYAVAADPAQKETLRRNIVRMVDELRECQERTFVFDKALGRYREARDLAPEAELRDMKGTWQAFDQYKTRPQDYGYGYLNAIPAQHCALIEMYRPYNNSDWVWAPYYSVHKQLAGLIDIATYFDDKATSDKALLIARDMGLWVWNRMHYRTHVRQDGTQDERRARPGNRYEMWDMYIAGEVGGMSESLARLADLTPDAADKARLLEAARCFDAPRFYDPLVRNIDDIRTRHANQHIPMIVGALSLYKSCGEARYYTMAENFWSLLQGRYVYATGGVGNGEMFRQPYTQVLSMATNGLREGEAQANPDINETCCAYNLLKLTRGLNCYNPDDARYMDYYERALFNQVVGSLNPHEYQTTYQYAVGLNATKPFGNETPQSSCCGGTGSENHTKYQEAAYFASDSTLWVALYMPTTLNWRAKGVTVRQECEWPAQASTFSVVGGEGDFALKLRVPAWATEGFEVRLNGEPVAGEFAPGSYALIPKRRWAAGDKVEVSMPFAKRIEYGPDKLPAEVASQDGAQLDAAWVGVLMYGPLAMTATDVATWRQATLDVDSRLSQVEEVDGAGALALKADGKLFLPDYFRNENSTHYFRINFSDRDGAVAPVGIDAEAARGELRSLLSLAAERRGNQERWMKMESKVPDYAPWAPHGYERLLAAMAAAERLGDDAPAASVEAVAAQLGKAVNTMRPGNLAEMEDLRPLNALLRRAGQPAADSNRQLAEAADYGRMVVRYVADGSGTQDMIDAAVARLSEALGQ